MSQHQFFKRMPVNPQVAQKLETTTFPAPTRGLMLAENESFMQPGAAVVMDNWKPTMKGCSLRGGCIRWAELPETTPVISAFEYASGIIHKMFAANATKVYDVTTTVPAEVASGRTSGNYVASQMANAAGDWLIAVNDAGDPLLRFNGTTWQSLATTTPSNWVFSHAYAIDDRARDTVSGARYKCLIAHTSAASGTFEADRIAHPTYWTFDLAPDGSPWIIGPAGTPVENGGALTYVCKYRNRYFFVERNSMNAWYLGLDAVGGQLNLIPMSGAATKGGKLLFCASWSIDAGDGVDDKIVFCTTLGELLIFTGSDPSNAASWRQEGRYEVSSPMGMNAHIGIGGDMLIATVDGIVPISGAITKDRSELELAAITRNIKPMWRMEVLEKREWPWTMCKWDEYGGLFVTWPGGPPGKRWCAAANLASGAWCRFVGYDATCFIKMRGDMFFGTQDGIIMQADRTGYDDGMPYTATLVGGWEVFQSPGQTITWRQARASFSARANEPFAPQLSATTDYVVVLPTPPNAGLDPGVLDLWDQGKWGPANWTFPAAWQNTHAYAIGAKAHDTLENSYWICVFAHTSSNTPTTFAVDRALATGRWVATTPNPQPPIPPTPEEIELYAQWDQPTPSTLVVRNTGWVSIGRTGFSHAPVVQVTVAQQAKPEVDLISIAATFERAGVNV